MEQMDKIQKEQPEKEIAQSLAAIATELQEIKRHLRDIADSIREKK